MDTAKLPDGTIVDTSFPPSKPPYGDFYCTTCNKLAHFRRYNNKDPHFYHKVENPRCPRSSETADYWKYSSKFKELIYSDITIKKGEYIISGFFDNMERLDVKFFVWSLEYLFDEFIKDRKFRVLEFIDFVMNRFDDKPFYFCHLIKIKISGKMTPDIYSNKKDFTMIFNYLYVINRHVDSMWANQLFKELNGLPNRDQLLDISIHEDFEFEFLLLLLKIFPGNFDNFRMRRRLFPNSLDPAKIRNKSRIPIIKYLTVSVFKDMNYPFYTDFFLKMLQYPLDEVVHSWVIEELAKTEHQYTIIVNSMYTYEKIISQRITQKEYALRILDVIKCRISDKVDIAKYISDKYKGKIPGLNENINKLLDLAKTS